MNKYLTITTFSGWGIFSSNLKLQNNTLRRPRNIDFSNILTYICLIGISLVNLVCTAFKDGERTRVKSKVFNMENIFISP